MIYLLLSALIIFRSALCYLFLIIGATLLAIFVIIWLTIKLRVAIEVVLIGRIRILLLISLNWRIILWLLIIRHLLGKCLQIMLRELASFSILKWWWRLSCGNVVVVIIGRRPVILKISLGLSDLVLILVRIYALLCRWLSFLIIIWLSLVVVIAHFIIYNDL